jgi:DNA-binding NarL/FixJ family response regulator
MIVDDQKLFRENLKIVIELRIPDARVVALAANGEEAYAAFRRHEPELILLDIRMPLMNGVEFIRKLKAEGSLPKIIVLTTFDDDEYVIEAMKLGARGYLLKEIDPEDLTKAILQVRNGEMPLSPKVTAKLIRQGGVPAGREELPGGGAIAGLTPRELSVLKRIALGEDNREIAEGLFLAEGTVKNHVSSIYDKLGLKDRAQAVRFALVNGLV